MFFFADFFVVKVLVRARDEAKIPYILAHATRTTRTSNGNNFCISGPAPTWKMPQSFVKSSGAPSKAVAWQHPPVGSPSLHAASVAVAFECRSRPHARSEAGCSPAQHHGGKNIGHHVGCVPNMILSKCSPDWGFSFKETEKKLGKKHEASVLNIKTLKFLDTKRCSPWQTKNKKIQTQWQNENQDNGTAVSRPPDRDRCRLRTGLWKCETLEAGHGKTVKFLWAGRWWPETLPIAIGKIGSFEAGTGCWTLFGWFEASSMPCGLVVSRKGSFPRWLCRYRRCFRSHAPCSRFSWSAMPWPRTKTDQKRGSQSPNFEPTAKTTSSANHRKSPFRPPGQKAWQTCPRCATATPCLAKPRALGTNAASPEARPDATSALKQGISNRNNRRNIYVNQIGKVLCRRNTTYLLTLFMDLVARLQLLWVILSCASGTWCSSKTRWWF